MGTFCGQNTNHVEMVYKHVTMINMPIRVHETVTGINRSVKMVYRTVSMIKMLLTQFTFILNN